MCQTIPGRVIQVQDGQAEVETDGYTGWFNTGAQPGVKPDDWVLTHADLVVSIISEAEAQRLQQSIRDARQARDAGSAGGGASGSGGSGGASGT
jgi:hydrogenase assembly chaperone HypC/HupF